MRGLSPQSAWPRSRLLHSIAGIIRSQGQSNHIAGNTYQTMLAEYRVGLGEKAVFINISLFEGE
ncbi:hypothetical protein GGR53DRAFT_77163 [Hypoxylon sp. FL1150]|nr:hypothetical protein GGR53DRAFT_77163 [Hypoxylon sp. FL1150]